MFGRKKKDEPVVTPIDKELPKKPTTRTEGEYYEYRNNITDPDLTYVRIVGKGIFGQPLVIEIKSFGDFGTKDHPTIRKTEFGLTRDEEQLSRMTKLTKEEFEIKINPILDSLGLQSKGVKDEVL